MIFWWQLRGYSLADLAPPFSDGNESSLERNSVILPSLGLMRSNNVPKARPTGTRRKGCLCPRWLRLETLDDYDVKIYNGDGDCRSERQGYFRSSAALTYWDKKQRCPRFLYLATLFEDRGHGIKKVCKTGGKVAFFRSETCQPP
ncbi:hypothetical protein NC652_020581 [Populus alba x Populus x berolinensis]|nr:hypothetical protein NC652_020581 [Populus alba x Populus x berolinensis]